ncbi:MAG: radical SAM protein [Desulfobacterium sp.]|nr:radical SAM protein [Desulfobacterium sp.]
MKRFKKVYIEITNTCNLSCNFCLKSARKSGMQTKESFQYILNEIKPFTDYIFLHVKGEPLLHPELLDFLDLADSFGIKVNITTNGVLINKVQDAFLKKPAIRQINFSLHSLTENKKENYLGDILHFVHAALTQTHIIISLRLWNLHKKDMAGDGKNKVIISAIEDRFCGEIEGNVIAGKGLKIKERLYLNTDYEFEWPNLDTDYQNENGFCYALRDQIAILVDGTVVPCCLDGDGITDLGNIFYQNFSRIINSERAKAIYNGFSNHKAIEALCTKCRYKERFEKIGSQFQND